ncbi:hypothetical protein D3871_29070 [Noviherbaspirillum saxi]|uniref:Uncharacterized protein n=1 Tax=Noviherbaspirillum saxi TaxID=2320863 RepID=A0A3A3FMR5_9BURK|nr:hypothetical protein D3871_29070 [Noviherbaspirillum saxi]
MASHGKEMQRRAAGKASGIDGTVRVKLLLNELAPVSELCGRFSTNRGLMRTRFTATICISYATY